MYERTTNHRPTVIAGDNAARRDIDRRFIKLQIDVPSPRLADIRCLSVKCSFFNFLESSVLDFFLSFNTCFNPRFRSGDYFLFRVSDFERLASTLLLYFFCGAIFKKYFLALTISNSTAQRHHLYFFYLLLLYNKIKLSKRKLKFGLRLLL